MVKVRIPGNISDGNGAGDLVAKENLDFFPPGIIDADKNNFDTSIKVSQEFFRGGMEAESG